MAGFDEGSCGGGGTGGKGNSSRVALSIELDRDCLAVAVAVAAEGGVVALAPEVAEDGENVFFITELAFRMALNESK